MIPEISSFQWPPFRGADQNDEITENSGEGTDTVQSTVSYTLSAYTEILTLLGNSAINGTGNASINVLYGNSASNILDGGANNDSMYGGLGDDTYIVDSASDSVTENVGEGTDRVNSSVNYTLGSNLENLDLLPGAVRGVGNELDNWISGNGADNSLVGGAGNDTLRGVSGVDTFVGGTGDDTYYVDHATTDVVTESANEGIDTVVASSASYTLGSNLENLTLDTGASNGTGNILNNLITGNASNNSLNGDDGDDTLNGGAGNDTLSGGLGSDLYIITDSNANVLENSSEGTDTVQSTVSYTLTDNVENLILSGSALTGVGNALNNSITGNGSNNILNGGTGADTLSGGVGDDYYVVDDSTDTLVENSGEGIDTIESGISYTLSTYFENLTLSGSASNGLGNSANNRITGNAVSNLISGLDGNDTLDGGIGADTLVGGLGDDVFVIDNSSDVITENSSEGIDAIQSSVTYTVSSNVENITLTGSQAINASGNSSSNTIIGNSGSNSLSGLGGNDYLDGGNDTVADTLIGGLGDDTFVIRSASDSVVENLGEGMDLVLSAISYTLGSHLENLTLTGSGSITGVGNSLANAITGNSVDNVLDGGSDILVDTLSGGLGNDTYILNSNDLIVENTNQGVDTVQSSGSYTLVDNVENLVLTGTSAIAGTGNALNNSLVGNTGSNTLSGAGGNDTLDGGSDSAADTLLGGIGNDTFIVRSAIDTVVENSNEGTDTIQAHLSYTLGSNLENLLLVDGYTIHGVGNSLDNLLTGNAAANSLSGSDGNDTLNGGQGADTLVGGLGDDTFIIDNIGDVLTENTSEGTDTVQSIFSYTLGSNFENLTLLAGSATQAVGTSGDNMLVGNSNANLLKGLDGNDTLDGGVGADTMLGGVGNDTFVVDNTNDWVLELGSEGTDTIQTYVAYTLSDNIENMTLLGEAWINGTGNALNNSIVGNSGNNKLDGKAGIDTLTGGLGNDTYVVDNASDALVENADEGTDSVQSSISYTLASNFENLLLTGASNINATGTSSDNYLAGNGGNNSITGGGGLDTLVGNGGNDSLYGGTGNDIYQFEVACGQDVINDSDATGGNVDTVLFGYTVNRTAIAFFMNGSDLQIGFTSSPSDVITIQSQTTSNTAVERFETYAGYYMTDADVSQLISDLSSYASTNSISFTSLNDVMNSSELMGLIQDAWAS